MKYYENILETVGATPLVKLNKLSKGLKPLILAKMECFNPGGSVKDRPALKMIEEAEKAGLLKPGGTIIEPTSGNTGTGLAQIAAVKGYRCILICPDKVAQEKINLLRAYGAEVVMVPTSVSASSHESYYSVANRMTAEIPDAYQPNQFANPHNPGAHMITTGPEIWEQTGGKVTHFVAGVGTGGTISGIGRYLKDKNPSIKIVGVDPEGSIYSGDMAQPYKVEGIGEDFLPRNADLKLIDEFVRVSDKDSFVTARRLAREEGLLVGGSCGTAAAAALRIAKNLSDKDVVVILMPDGGRGYLSKQFSDEWMMENGFLPAPGHTYYASDLIERKRKRGKLPDMIVVSPGENVQHAIELMELHQVDQIPVVTEDGQNVGHINDLVAMQVVYERKDPAKVTVNSIMGRPFPQLDVRTEIDQLYKTFRLGNAMVVLTKEGKAVGVVTKFDIMTHLREALGSGHDEVEKELAKHKKEETKLGAKK
ncbi:MAG: cystathionine beta-synthase [Candidatus Melainabacteria bacterium]|nr:cystathionine beta-synthase [Candidatus Melainabacteria bacterium]